MKQRKKTKMISIITTVCMMVTMFSGMTATVKAEATIIDASSYDSLITAIAGAHDGDTINITNDITISSEIGIMDKALIIQGNNHTITVLRPGLDDSGVYNSNPSTFRVFTIYASGKTVEIKNLTVKGGCTTSKGAGIANGSGTILKLTNVNVSNSWCNGSSITSSGGGGIVNSGTLYLKNCNISRNAAFFGGGFYNIHNSKMFVENCTFSENRSTYGGGGAGDNEGVLYVNNSTFSNNQSFEVAGAINNGDTAYFVNSTFTGNGAYGVSWYGGALHNGKGTVINCLFAYNYSNSTDGPPYILNDISGSIKAYYSVFHAKLVSGTGNTQYTGAADGSNNSLFVDGISRKVLNNDGTELGTANVFQPLLEEANGSSTPTAMLKANTVVSGNGVKTSFTNGDGTPTIGYYNQTEDKWETLIGSNAENYEVTTDQNNITRSQRTPTVGAVEMPITVAYLDNGSTGGTVPATSSYTLGEIATVSSNTGSLIKTGYTFTGWNTSANGSGVSYVAGDTITIVVAVNSTLYAKWTPNAPTETLTGVSPTTFGGNNGKITGTTTAMEYKLSTEPTTWIQATETEITNLAEGTYNVRYAATAGFDAGTAADVAVYYTLINGDIDLTSASLDEGHKTIKINGGNAKINGAGRHFKNLAIEISGGAQLTIENLKIDNSGWNSGKSPISVTDNNAMNTLKLSGENEVKGSAYKPGVNVAGSNTLIISANSITDKLTATGVDLGAGIGGGSDSVTGAGESGGNITITGGTVTAIGGAGGAGIGGGSGSVTAGGGGIITISAGTVTATGGAGGAGIGAGGGNAGASTTLKVDSTAVVKAYSDGTKKAIDVTADTLTADSSAYLICGTLTSAISTTSAIGIDIINKSGNSTAANLQLPSSYKSFGITLNSIGTYNIKTTEVIPQIITKSIGNSIDFNSQNNACFFEGITALIDSTPPADATFTADVTASTNESVKVTINYPSDATIKKYSLNGSDYSDYTQFIEFTSNGIVYAKSQDSDGNWSTTTQYNVTNIDKTVPTLTAGAVNRTSDTNATVKFTSSEGGQYYYQVVNDGAAEPVITTTAAGVACSAGETTITNPTGLTSGEKDIYIVVKDAAGNNSALIKLDIATYVPPYVPPYVPSTPTPQPSSETRQTPVIVNNDGQQTNAVQVTITRTTDTMGLKTDTVKFDEATAAATVKKVLETKTSSVAIFISDISGNNADKVETQLPKASMAQLANNNISLNLGTEKASLELTAETIAKLKDQDIKIQIGEEKDSSKVANTKGLILQLASGSQIITTPLNIEANFTGRVKITIPIDASKLPSSKEELDKFLLSLAVMVHHSDGEDVVDKGAIVYDEKGNVIGMCIYVDKFSSFTLIEIPKDYFQGKTTVMKDKVEADKEWNIKFTKVADATTVTKDNVYVTDLKGNKVDVKVSYGLDNILKVSPADSYTSGETYYLYITKAVKAKDETPLVNELRYQFTIK